MECIVCLLIAVGMFALGTAVPGGALLFLFVLIPMFFVYIRSVTTVAWALIFILAYTLAVMLMRGTALAVVSLCCILPISMATGYAMRRRLGFYYSALASGASTFAALGIFMLCIYLFTGSTVNELILNSFEENLRAYPEQAKLYYYLIMTMNGDVSQLVQISQDALGNVDIESVAAISEETAINESMYYLRSGLTMYMPLFAVGGTALMGLLNYIVPRFFVKKLGGRAGGIPAFSMWSLPNRFGTWSLILLVVAMIGEAAGWNNFSMVSSIILGFMYVVYTIQGLAFIDWLLGKKIESAGARIAILVITYILIGYMIYMWIGFFEQAVKIRKRGSLFGK